MAVVTRDSSASVDASTAMLAAQITGLKAGANLPLLSPCYIKGADGLVYPSDGTAADEKARFAGVTPRATNAGEPVTLFGVGTRFRYTAAAGLTPGAPYFISATAGAIDTAATTGDAVGVFQAVDDTDLRVTRNV